MAAIDVTGYWVVRPDDDKTVVREVLGTLTEAGTTYYLLQNPDTLLVNMESSLVGCDIYQSTDRTAADARAAAIIAAYESPPENPA